MKGILSTSLRSETIARKEKRARLAYAYFFDGTEICKTAFMGIYGIGKTKWRNIRSHFDHFDLQIRTSSLQKEQVIEQYHLMEFCRLLNSY